MVSGRIQPFKSVNDLMDAGVSLAGIELLAKADAFLSIGIDRRKALFEVYALSDRPEGIYTGQSAAIANEKQIQLPKMALSEHVVEDYGATSLSLKAHPVSFVRSKLTALNIKSTSDLKDLKDRDWVKVSGIVLVR